MPELVLSPSLDLSPWRGESLSTSIYETPMSPVVVKFRGTDKPACNADDESAKHSELASEEGVPPPLSLETRSVGAVGLMTGLTPAKLRMLQSHFKAKP